VYATPGHGPEQPVTRCNTVDAFTNRTQPEAGADAYATERPDTQTLTLQLPTVLKSLWVFPTGVDASQFVADTVSDLYCAGTTVHLGPNNLKPSTVTVIPGGYSVTTALGNVVIVLECQRPLDEPHSYYSLSRLQCLGLAGNARAQVNLQTDPDGVGCVNEWH